MKLLLIGYYHLKDGFAGSMSALKKLYSYEIEFFPLSAYHNDYADEKFSYLKKFIQRTISLSELSDGSIYLGKQSPNVILWWNFNIGPAEMADITACTTAINIFYSWDDPYWVEHQLSNPALKFIDVAFTCCKKSIDFYKRNGCKFVFYAKPGFDAEKHRVIDNPTFDCDVSIVCTTFYNGVDDQAKAIDRLQLLQRIAVAPDINLRIYGPDHFKNIFPQNYCKSVDFDSTYEIFNRSKINICTHARKNTGMAYINERTCQILGSGGLLYIDDITGLDQILDREAHCVVIDEDNVVDQIRYILNNYEKFESVKQAGRAHAMKTLTWDRWAETIHQGIVQKLRLDCLIIGQDLPMCTKDTIQSIKPIPHSLQIVYILCLLIRQSTMSYNNYILYLNKFCKKNNIDVNDFLQTNMMFILADRAILA